MAFNDWFKDRLKDYLTIKLEEFSGSSLGGKIGNTFIRGIKKIFDAITDWFEERLINFAVGVLVRVERSGKTIVGKLISQLKSYGAIPDFLKPIFDEAENPQHEIGALLIQSVGGTAIGGLFGAIFDPLMANVKYVLNTKLTPYFPTLQEASAGKTMGILGDGEFSLIMRSLGFDESYNRLFTQLYKNHIPYGEIADLYYRKHIGIGEVNQFIRELGFDNKDADLLENLLVKLPDINSSISAYFRNDITLQDLVSIADQQGINTDFLNILLSANKRILDLNNLRDIYFRLNKPESWVKENLLKLGIDPESIDDLIGIFPYFPNVPDLVRFAVREAYTPSIINQYKLYEDLPDKFLEEAKKAGLPEDQAKNYWASHWELPSLTMGFEMLHREIITTDDLMTLMRTQDVMPYWRDKLIQISYNPLTRVDVRRMFSVGVLNESQVFKAYKDIGYNEENARYLTEFTILSTSTSEKTLSKADILDGYRKKLLSRDEASSYITMLGYSTEQADYFLEKEDYKDIQDTKKMYLDLIEDSYKKEIITENDVIQQLSSYGFLDTEIQYHLSKWNIAKTIKTSKPSKEDLKLWLKMKIINSEDFRFEMQGLGFPDKYINNYLSELGYKV